MATKEKVNFTIDSDLIRRIREMADAENRNFSNMVEVLLQNAVEHRDNSQDD